LGIEFNDKQIVQQVQTLYRTFFAACKSSQISIGLWNDSKSRYTAVGL